MFLILMKGVGIILEGKKMQMETWEHKRRGQKIWGRNLGENTGQVAGIWANSSCLAFGKFNLILNEKNCLENCLGKKNQQHFPLPSILNLPCCYYCQ